MKNKQTKSQLKFAKRLFSSNENVPFDSMVWFESRRMKLLSNGLGKVWRGTGFC